MEPFIGQIKMFGGNFTPRGWALCDGQLLPINQNQSLFSILGTTYGGDGRTTFALPDLRGRLAMHTGNGPGLTPRPLGQKGGVENNVLVAANLPAHNHTIALNAKEEGNTDDPNGAFIAGDGTNAFSTTSDTNLATTTSGNTGASLPINNIQPFMAVNYIIALTGTFPSRN